MMAFVNIRHKGVGVRAKTSLKVPAREKRDSRWAELAPHSSACLEPVLRSRPPIGEVPPTR